MPRSWTHTSAFAHFGTRPPNVQWSWSARNEASRTVVVTFWQDQLVRREGKLVYERPGHDPLHPDTRLGFRELMDNMAWSRDHCGGLLRIIVAIARDRNADPRSIRECFPSKMSMRLTHLDTESGAFRAEAEGL